ncbi:hypothetical protein C8F04DRAFT_1195975 [Mycena alexandri]|uniref:Uncharacterized protein n=1 Tax=Mycena alexandri TaxID=1745969 RepID=A0AAD6S4K6_9AGAR|nr:hypothetical protein C8F04DRAFT_1195975 [Mycena alexandri]
MVDGHTKLFQLWETEIKKLKNQIEETVNSRTLIQLDQLREVSHNKIALEVVRSSQLEEELQMQSVELVAARTRMEHLEAQARANQSVLIGQQAAFRRILATSCEGFNQSPQEIERGQILEALGLLVARQNLTNCLTVNFMTALELYPDSAAIVCSQAATPAQIPTMSAARSKYGVCSAWFGVRASQVEEVWNGLEDPGADSVLSPPGG